MADVDKILRLVAEGALTPQEADEILAALERSTTPPRAPTSSPREEASGPRQLRIEVTEGGKRVVNLRVPLNVAGGATSFLPGLSDQETNRIRGALESGVRGPILDVGGDDGSRVLITSE